MARDRPQPARGTSDRPAPRYLATAVEPFDDGWGGAEGDATAPRTTVRIERARSIVTRNDSPDVPFAQSLNPYRGCEHGCIYCYARPNHAYLDLSPGLDFESVLVAKPDAPRLLERYLRRPSTRPAPIALGTSTDAYQPVERELGITRGLLEVMDAYGHPIAVVTKSTGILRDLDLLARLSARGLVHVIVSLTTLDADLARRMEPRAAAPSRRLTVLRRLSEAGIPVGVFLSPTIPAINDGELEALLEAAAEAGATMAASMLLRLPREVADLFAGWLDAHFPDRKERVLSLLRQARGGRLSQARFGARMVGTGPYAQMLRRRFELARAHLGLDQDLPPLSCDAFAPPPVPILDHGPQLHLPLL